jgi:serine/threonine protein kinase
MRYAKEIKIGGGGFADVYKAVDWNAMKYVAVKELRDLFPENYRRFRRERDMLTKYKDNPYVVNILDSEVENSERPYIVLEYSPYGSLQKYVTSRRDWKRVGGWLCDVARGLEIVHDNGDVHRDIKPSNLIQCRYEREIIKLTDFGLAIRNDNPSGPMTCSPFGTEGYIDPVAKITGVLTTHSDIYSLGVTMRELLTGNREKSFWTTLPGPQEFRSLIDSMTERDVNKRPSARRIYETVEWLLTRPEPQPLNIPWAEIITFGGIALAAVAASANTYDEKAGRYRNSKGQFASGWLG